MHPKVLSRDAWRVVQRLVRAGHLGGWTLAGGTGLALQLGHRYSEDLDFFRLEPFDPSRLAEQLSSTGPLVIHGSARGTLHGALDGVRLSFLQSEAPLLFPGTPYRRLMIADPRDIAVMKVIAIASRGSRKDFIDLFVYLETGGTLESVLTLVQRRFPAVDYNEYHLLKSLVYFTDAKEEPMPRMIRDLSWNTVKAAITAEVQRVSSRI